MQCTKPCNGGFQVRNVTCAGDTSCNDEKPDVNRSCNEHQCSEDLSMEILNIEEGGEQHGNGILPSEAQPSSSLLSVTSISNNSMLPLGDNGNNIHITNSSSDPIEGGINIYNNVHIESNHSHKHRHHHHHSQSKDNNVTNSVPEVGSWASPDSGKMPSMNREPMQAADNTHSALPNHLNSGNLSFIWQTLQWTKVR